MRGFVVSWFFPPVNSSEGLITFKLLKNSRIKHDVFTQNKNNLWSYNTSEKSLVNKNIETIFGESDSFHKWIDSCLEYFDKNNGKYDFIMSRSMPPESHSAALRIKNKYSEMKWIASFGDPIYNSPYNRLTRNACLPKITVRNLFSIPIKIALLIYRARRHPLQKLVSLLARRYRERLQCSEERQKSDLEREIILKADCLIFNNEYQKLYMLEGYPETVLQKAVVFPHSFDIDLYPKKARKHNPRDRIVLSYLGHLDHLRTPLPLLKALDRLKSLKPASYDRLTVDFYGNVDDMSKIYIFDHALFDIVKINKPVGYLESLAIMRDSDWCLLIDANLSKLMNENIYFAAKIADYLGSGSNIFGISMLDGASADVIRETGGVLSTHSVDEIFMYLNMIIDGRLDNSPKNVDKYDCRNVVKTYDAIVDNLLDGHKTKSV